MRTWFITGASRGFGALIAAEALAAGDHVVATGRDPRVANLTHTLDHNTILLSIHHLGEESGFHPANGYASSALTGAHFSRMCATRTVSIGFHL